MGFFDDRLTHLFTLCEWFIVLETFYHISFCVHVVIRSDDYYSISVDEQVVASGSLTSDFT